MALTQLVAEMRDKESGLTWLLTTGAPTMAGNKVFNTIFGIPDFYRDSLGRLIETITDVEKAITAEISKLDKATPATQAKTKEEINSAIGAVITCVDNFKKIRKHASLAKKDPAKDLQPAKDKVCVAQNTMITALLNIEDKGPAARILSQSKAITFQQNVKGPTLMSMHIADIAQAVQSEEKATLLANVQGLADYIEKTMTSKVAATEEDSDERAALVKEVDDAVRAVKSELKKVNNSAAMVQSLVVAHMKFKEKLHDPIRGKYGVM